MGTFSLVLRAPLVAAVFTSSETTVYLAGVLPCLLATLALGLALARMLADRGASEAVQGVVAGSAASTTPFCCSRCCSCCAACSTTGTTTTTTWPFVLSLLAWETVRRAAFPYLTVAVAVLLGLSFWATGDQVFGDSVANAQLLNALYLAWALPLAAGLAVALYRPGVGLDRALGSLSQWSFAAPFSSSRSSSGSRP